jgi:RIO kinase 2
VHIGNKCDGYKLTFLGYDYLAIQTFMKRGLIKDVICKIGVGKESDIYKCVNPEGEFIVLKLTRLGRNSFRSIKKNR